MNLLSDGDVSKVRDAISQVIKDAIGQAANVLVPAIAEAAKGTLTCVSVTVGPITIEPIKITVGTEQWP